MGWDTSYTVIYRQQVYFERNDNKNNTCLYKHNGGKKV